MVEVDVRFALTRGSVSRLPFFETSRLLGTSTQITDRAQMTKSDKDLNLAEQYDKKAQEHIRKVLEWGQSAIKATNPAEREKYSEVGRKERETAINALTDANIALWL
jgi:hypothetical protein